MRALQVRHFCPTQMFHSAKRSSGSEKAKRNSAGIELEFAAVVDGGGDLGFEPLAFDDPVDVPVIQ